MGIYGDYIFPALMDWSMRRLGDLRQEALARARGQVLEIGFGTGLNLRHYPPGVERLQGLDPIKGLRNRVRERIAKAPFPVELVRIAANGRLPFDEKSFDCVVTTWTLCSVDRPIDVLREVRRVLRPDGIYIFLEHGRSDDPRVERWQRRFNPVQRRIGGGCELDRPIDTLIRSAGFELEEIDRFLNRQDPRIFAEMYRGIGRP
jgi:ubiquinone/menaquinone biosynthesis C-methylase UbiE